MLYHEQWHVEFNAINSENEARDKEHADELCQERLNVSIAISELNNVQKQSHASEDQIVKQKRIISDVEEKISATPNHVILTQDADCL